MQQHIICIHLHVFSTVVEKMISNLDWAEPSHSIPLGETWDTCNVCKTLQSYRVQLLKFCNITDTGRTLSNQNE